MIQFQNASDAQTSIKHVRKETFEGSVTDLIAKHEVREPGAQAFLVQQSPNWSTPPHFHLEQQFQVVVAGEGAIGRHPVMPLTVHYAGPETGYGPINAGPEGLSYLTLRAEGDTGAWYLHKPGSRERMQPGLKREQQHGSPQEGIRDTALTALSAIQVQDMIPLRADGLSAKVIRLPRGETLQAPSVLPHGGRFFVITDGALDSDTRHNLALSVIHVPPEETFQAKAGAEGAEVLILQFPALDARP